MKKLILILFIFGFFQISFSLEQRYQFNFLTVDDGLASNSITSIVQDSSGFLWISTYHGLHRYDGYEFKIYTNDPKDSTSLNTNSLYGLFFDSKNTLWIKSVGNGLGEYDAANDCFIRYVHDPEDPNSICGNYIRDLTEDKNGNLWIGTWGNGLCYMDRQTKKFKYISASKDNPNGLQEDINLISTLTIDHENRLWIGTIKGLYSYQIETQTWKHHKFDQDQSKHLQNLDISKVYIAPDSTIWLGTWGGGVKFLDKRTERIKHFPQSERHSKQIIDDRIYCLYHDTYGNFWCGLTGSGIIKIDIQKDAITRIKHDPANPHSLSSNSILHIFQDRTGSLWMASHFGGINILRIKNQQFNHFYPLHNNPNYPEGSVFHVIEEDNDGRIWLGTHNNGVDIYNPETGQFTSLNSDPKKPNSLSNSEIRILESSQHGGMWIGTAAGLDYYDLKTGHITYYKHDPNNPNSISDNLIFALEEDQKGNLWIGTYNMGLSYFNLKNHTFKHFKHNPNDTTSLDNNIIQDILIDQLNRVWIASSDGINLYQSESNSFKHYLNSSKKKHTHISSLYEDMNGILWISVNSGLIQFKLNNDGTYKTEHFTTKDGLSTNMVAGVLADDHQNLWIATSAGLNKFNPETKNNIIFTKNDGLQSNVFVERSCFRSPKTGMMYFGGSNGFNMFDPDAIEYHKDASQILITNIELFNEPIEIGKKYNNKVILKKAIHLIKSIQLDYNQNELSIKFAAMNFKGASDNHYACKLSGFESDWRDRGSQNEITYTNLDPGKYLFEVKRMNHYGELSEQSGSLKIIITPPFWQRLWFKILLFLFIALIIFIGYETRVHTLKKRQQILEEKIAERTEALSNSNKELEHFAYVASHDLQEPLRMVTSYLQLLERRYKDQLDESAQEFIDFAVDGAKRMQQLISDLLSYSRIRTQGKPFEPVNMQEITDHVIMNLELSIEENKAEIHHQDLPTINADSIQMERLMQNLIGNAIKYRKKDEDPVVHIAAEQKDDQWIFSIKDNSIGIPDDQYDRIFNVFQRLHGREEYSGTGIGLASCKKIVERHKGKIWVESKQGVGSTFYFSIPNS